ncbi:MAG: succinylglutamate desuccinylase/aspartoacylase family protein, partial [Enterococcus sp.]
ILERPQTERKELTLIRQVCYFNSPITGLWTPACEIGETVKKGQLLGTIEDFFGNVLYEVKASQDGLILYQVASLAIVKGEALISYGL